MDRGATRVISVGGDGTVHEIVNSIYGKGVELGVVPLGTGNDFARTIGTPLDPEQAARVALTGRTSAIDLGQVDGEIFMNVAGVGYDAEVAAEANRMGMLINGQITYITSLLKMLVKYRCADVTIDIDGRAMSGRILLVAVGNGKYYGGGMKITPGAVIDDGVFEIVVAGDLTRLETLMTLPKVYTGRHIEHPKASTHTGRRVRIESRERLSVHADGEIVATTPVEFRILENALQVVRYAPGETGP